MLGQVRLRLTVERLKYEPQGTGCMKFDALRMSRLIRICLRGKFARRAALTSMLLILFAIAAPVKTLRGQDASETGPPLDEPAMQAELKRLEGICESLGLAEEAELCSQWLPSERADQTLLYLPIPAKQPSTSNPKQAAWVKHFESARIRHSDHWFAQCRKAIEAGDEQRGYQLLWRTLREYPQHAEAKRTLGRLATSATMRPAVRRSTAKHPTFNWPGNSYTRVESPHFYLTSRASTAETIAIAMQLEEFYSLWTQYFYPLWAPPGLLKSRLNGGVSPFETSRQIKVVLLRDRADYIETLGAREENIGVSVGYYDPNSQTSFFFPDKNLAATFYHELTHQLLAEATRLKIADNIGAKGDVWLLEGIALYMESLNNREGYWTLGGWESPRLQTARYRAIRDGSFVPWKDFSSGELDEWKANPDIARLYSQAAGVTHLMLDSYLQPEVKEHRKEILFQSIVALYQGQPDSSRVELELGGREIQQAYEAEITVADDQVASLRDEGSLQELVLAGSELSTDAWQQIPRLTSLEWLDLSFANAMSSDLKGIEALQQLERLSVEGTSVDGELLDAIRKLPKLSELDLTACAIDDRALQKLASHPQLATLWLGKTQITEASLATLESMPKLKFADTTDTKITPAAWTDFLKRNPRFNSPRK